MSKKKGVIEIKVEPNIRNTVLAIDQLTMAKDMAVVKDHHICYGEKVPLCGVLPIGGRGLIADESFITCPECKNKLLAK